MYIFEFLNSKCHRRHKTKYPNVINEKIIGKNSNLNLVILSYNVFTSEITKNIAYIPMIITSEIMIFWKNFIHKIIK